MLVKTLCSYRGEIVLGGLLSYFIAREVSRDGLKVVLTGEGVDVIFGGMPRYLKLSETELKEMMINDQNKLWHATNRRMDHSAKLCSIEARAPFEDLRVIANARNIPIKKRVDLSNVLKDKILLREIAQKYLPSKIVCRAKTTISGGTGIEVIAKEVEKEIGGDYFINQADLKEFELHKEIKGKLVSRSVFELICFSMWRKFYPSIKKTKKSLIERKLYMKTNI